MLRLQLSVIEPVKQQTRSMNSVVSTAERLEDKQNISAVEREIETIREVQSSDFWQDVTMIDLERVRIALRDLIRFIDKQQKRVVYTDFNDQIESHDFEVDLPMQSNLKDYRSQVTQYLKKHQNHITIQKVRKNQPITETDLTELEKMLFAEGNGTREQFEDVFGKGKPLGVFVREILGLDQGAAREAFSELLTKVTLNGNQIHFINQIIEYFTQNGVLEPQMLFREPFTDVSSSGIVGVFPESEAERIIHIIEHINETAIVASEAG